MTTDTDSMNDEELYKTQSILQENEALKARVAELEAEYKDLCTISEAQGNDLNEATFKAEAWRLMAVRFGWTENAGVPIHEQMAMTREALEAIGYRRETTMIEGLISGYRAMEESRKELEARYKRSVWRGTRWKEAARKLGVHQQPAEFWGSIYEKIGPCPPLAGREGEE